MRDTSQIDITNIEWRAYILYSFEYIADTYKK